LERWSSDGRGDDYEYTGKEYDADTGLTYFGARYLEPRLGRWVSPDPAFLAVTAIPQSREFAGRWQYALNNPANIVDTNGTRTQVVGKMEFELGSQRFDSEATSRYLAALQQGANAKLSGVCTRHVANATLNGAEDRESVRSEGSLKRASAGHNDPARLANTLATRENWTEVTSQVVDPDRTYAHKDFVTLMSRLPAGAVVTFDVTKTDGKTSYHSMMLAADGRAFSDASQTRNTYTFGKDYSNIRILLATQNDRTNGEVKAESMSAHGAHEANEHQPTASAREAREQ
jgi:RHS repeat-associated protein